MQFLRALRERAAALRARWWEGPRTQNESSKVGTVRTVCSYLGFRRGQVQVPGPCMSVHTYPWKVASATYKTHVHIYLLKTRRF